MQRAFLKNPLQPPIKDQRGHHALFFPLRVSVPPCEVFFLSAAPAEVSDDSRFDKLSDRKLHTPF
jgi:hypothetical protein